MALVQMLVLIAFFSAIAGVFYFEARWLVFRLMHRWREPFWPRLPRRFERPMDWALNAVFIVGVLCILHGLLIEPTWIQVNVVELRSEKILPETGRIRIVQLSDIHSDLEPVNEEKVPAIVNALEPDIVVLTGDYYNEPEGLPLFEKMVRALKAPHGIYLIKGNYDFFGPELDPILERLPARWLAGGATQFLIRNSTIGIVGMDVINPDFFHPLMRSLRRTEKGLPMTVLLYHYSDLADDAAKAGVDLYLSGHTHGGQVRLPLYGALVTLAKFGKRFEAGLYDVDGMKLYVNRGLGMEGGAAFRVRFLCRPEIAVFDLLPAQG